MRSSDAGLRSRSSLLGSVAWSVDDTVDLDYHVRRIALPKPGRIRELFHYVS